MKVKARHSLFHPKKKKRRGMVLIYPPYSLEIKGKKKKRNNICYPRSYFITYLSMRLVAGSAFNALSGANSPLPNAQLAIFSSD